MRVAHHHAQAFVTEQLGDRAEADARHGEARGVVMAEVVPCEIVNPCVLQRGVEGVLHSEHGFARVPGVARMDEHVRTLDLEVALGVKPFQPPRTPTAAGGATGACTGGTIPASRAAARPICRRPMRSG